MPHIEIYATLSLFCVFYILTRIIQYYVGRGYLRLRIKHHSKRNNLGCQWFGFLQAWKGVGANPMKKLVSLKFSIFSVKLMAWFICFDEPISMSLFISMLQG